MKYKTTRKSVVENSTNIIAIGYCGADHLLRGIEPRAYTCGVYGWNFDVYEVHGLTICTGYRGMPGRNAKNLDGMSAKRARFGKTTTDRMKTGAQMSPNFLSDSVLRRDEVIA